MLDVLTATLHRGIEIPPTPNMKKCAGQVKKAVSNLNDALKNSHFRDILYQVDLNWEGEHGCNV